MTATLTTEPLFDLREIYAIAFSILIMEKRAAIPPGLPRSQPTVSYWQDPPDAIADHQTTIDLTEHVDVVIIGGGITGATIAYNVLTAHTDAKVLLLEARQAASGASGRNGRSTDHA